VTSTALDVDALKVLVPAYTALRESDPTGSVEVVIVATPEDRVPVPRAVPPL